ncbi:uncharacterized protein Z520_05954 [Fonsecaea multimorphosa CBS 102226]|uniref:Major facilitator superfamily (MFS) profile domain-containing protein n=1 Tax=Fonsecaea multimorphosa CBS 102226 TaxID=1442371 RepID=A0A0D2KPK3_9EURO|nr:uncharacterized protein Z520_05954 [Fonsecaea multimorphosa CBS 102226]KIX98653.1 hypothetical protein Z520_05954 [Fonsecaea multimorphosa CBS 102226]
MPSRDGTSQIELQEPLGNRQITDEVEAHETTTLPPVDGGRAAWLFLSGSFCIEMLLWGFPFSFGVLQDYYSTHPPISRQATGISAIGTTCSGILYLGAPLVFLTFQRWPMFLRRSLFVGLPIVVLAVFLSSFATKTWHLLLTQGILYAIGGNLVYYPIYSFIDEWFVRRKGFAYGVMWAGSGCGGLTGPLVLHWGLSKYGVETFLRGWAVALFILIAPFLFFVKPRIPPSRAHRAPARAIVAGFGFVKTKQFWIIEICNIIQGLGYFVPQLYLPAYARINGLHSGSLLVSLLNVAQVPGVMFLSALSDKVPVYTVILISSLGSTLAIFLLWGLASSSTGRLIAFTLCYGFFAGGFTAVYAGAAQEFRRVTPGGNTGRADLGSMMGLLGGGRGIGNVACGPVSEALLHASVAGWKGAAGAYSGSFGPLIVFAGTTAALTMSSWVAKVLKIV